MDSLPPGWIWARIADVTEPVRNVDPSSNPNAEFGYVDISSIDNESFRISEVRKVQGSEAPTRARRPIRPYDILFSNVRTYLRNIALVGEDSTAEVCSTGFTVLRPNAAIDPRYLFRYVLTDAFIDSVTPKQTGTHYPATSDRTVRGEMIPLPPLPEQRRIVSTLEELLGHVDESYRRLTRIPPLLKQFRQSVIDAACSGDLTSDWRDNERHFDKRVRPERCRNSCQNGRLQIQNVPVAKGSSAVTESASPDLPFGWRFVALAQLSTSFDYGTSAKSQPLGTIPVLRMGNIQNGEIDWTHLVYTSDPREIEKYCLKPNAVLFNRTNSPELVGKTAIYRGERPAIYAGYLIRINPLPQLDPEYLNYCLNTTYAKAFFSRVKTDGVSQSNINAQRLGTFEVPFCSLDEQKAAVQRVKALLAAAGEIESRYGRAGRSLANLTPGLLAKAFRGELVVNDLTRS
jgi:type I restriction enzyme S subunit